MTDVLSKLKQSLSKPFMIQASTGEYVPSKEARKVDLGIEAEFYVHRPIIGEGYVVSESSTGLKIESGNTADIAIGKARGKIKLYIEKNGKESFLSLLNNSKRKTDEKPKKAVQEEIKPEPKHDIHSAIESSLNFLNEVNLEHIGELLGLKDWQVEDMIRMGSLGFFNPEKERWETPEQYLSGNVRQKLAIAEQFAETDPSYNDNVYKLKEVIPESIPSALIQYSLGAAWIPCYVFEAFAKEIFKIKITIQYMPTTGKFFCKLYTGVPTIQIKHTYSAGGKTGLEILNSTMNNQQIVITKDGVKRVDLTSAAQSMQEQLQDEFTLWIRENPDIEEETEKVYNNRHNAYVDEQVKVPSLTTYPNACTHIIPRLHQKKGVQKGLNDSWLFAHEAGSGKTYTAIMTAMEMKRLSLADKPLIVVQNKTITQFVDSFREMYPNANILVPAEKELAGNKRADFYYKIRDNDWDCIILPHSQFDLIPDDLDRQRVDLKRQITGAEEVLSRTSKYNTPEQYASAKRILKSLERELSLIDIDEDQRRKVRQMASEIDGSSVMLNFEQMGIDALLIDEFTRYKRLGYATSLSNVKGIDPAKSKRSQSAYMKIRWVQEQKEGRNTLFYTGTPISNTMAEAWTMMRYVRPALLRELGIEHFDQFAKTFGQIVPSLEQTGGGTFKIQNRFAKFQNLPELMTAFRACTDIVLIEDIKEFQDTSTIPVLEGGQITQVIIER